MLFFGKPVRSRGSFRC